MSITFSKNDPARTSTGKVEKNDEYVDDDNNDDDNEENSEKYEKNEKFHHVITSKGVSEKLLPDVIELEYTYPGEPRFLRKQKYPKALRFYKARQEKNSRRYVLQELMLYTSYDEKTYNEWHDDDKCIKAYLEAHEDIQKVKSYVMEWLENVEEGRYYVEEVLKNETNTKETGEILDAEKEQDVMDCEDEGIENDPMYDHLDLGNHNEQEFGPSTKWCKTIELKEEETLSKEGKNLDRNKRKVLDIALKYAQKLSKAETKIMEYQMHQMLLWWGELDLEN